MRSLEPLYCVLQQVTPVAVIIRGAAMKIYYTEGGGGGGGELPGVQAINQSAPGAIQSLNGVSTAAIQLEFSGHSKWHQMPQMKSVSCGVNAELDSV